MRWRAGWRLARSTARRWRSVPPSGSAVTLGEPLAAAPAVTAGPGARASYEDAYAAAAASWHEGYLRASPADLELGLLRSLLAAGTTPGGDGDREGWQGLGEVGGKGPAEEGAPRLSKG
jgi:hypothetical protein